MFLGYSTGEGEGDYRVGHYLRRQVADYIEARRMKDGGYCFYRVPPSSAMDTYFAVKSLSLLGLTPGHPETIVDFFQSEVRDGSLGGITSAFAAAEVMGQFGRITSDLMAHARQITMAVENSLGGFGAVENVDVEVASELEQTYRAARTLKIIGTSFDENRVTGFVSMLLNPDGGYGANGHSTLASTFYATEIGKLLNSRPDRLVATVDYLRRNETAWQASFDSGETTYIEDLFWLVKSLSNLGEKAAFPSRVARFVTGCQRSPFHGFARARAGGIATLENTYYALSILSEIGIILR